MSDEKPIEPITDEAIRSMVVMVESAEIMAKAMDLSVSRSLELMLRTMQIMATMQQKQAFSTLHSMLSPSKKVS